MPWRLFLYITRAMTSLLFANAGPVTFKAPASLQPNIALLPAQGYQMSNVEIFTKKLSIFESDTIQLRIILGLKNLGKEPDTQVTEICHPLVIPKQKRRLGPLEIYMPKILTPSPFPALQMKNCHYLPALPLAVIFRSICFDCWLKAH